MKTIKIILLVIITLTASMLACSAGTDNVTIGDTPKYICPSATPRATHTQPPPDPPQYQPYFSANLQRRYYANTGAIIVQITSQNAGGIYVRYDGSTATYPYRWAGTNGRYHRIGYSGTYAHTFTWRLYVPADVYRVSLTLRSDRGRYPISLNTYQSTQYSRPNPPPCCAPPPIYPTVQPTYTMYPSPTPYVRDQDYFLGDWIYSDKQASGLQIGFRLGDIQTHPTTVLDTEGNPQALYTWTMQIKNVGSIPYTLFPPAQMFISVIKQTGDAEAHGIWGPSLAAAEAAGIVFTDAMTWDMQDLMPDDEKTFRLAAYAPIGTAHKISYAMDFSQRDAGSATQVPGANIVSWLNQINTVCTGDIAHP